MSDFEINPATLPDTETDLNSYFNRLFSADTPAYQKLAYELQREFRAGGSPDISQIFIDRISLDAGKNTGSFRVVLDVDFTFGCEDVRTSKINQTSEWTFKTDHSAGKILFYSSPYAEARTTGDEF